MLFVRVDIVFANFWVLSRSESPISILPKTRETSGCTSIRTPTSLLRLAFEYFRSRSFLILLENRIGTSLIQIDCQ